MKLKIKNKKSSVTIFDSTMTELVTALVTMSQKNMSNLTLSITTIGDLLLHKKITNGDKPIEDVSLNIPIYQRPYKWTARNAIQLLDDIIEAMNSNKEKYRVPHLAPTRRRTLRHCRWSATYHNILPVVNSIRRKEYQLLTAASLQ